MEHQLILVQEEPVPLSLWESLTVPRRGLRPQAGVPSALPAARSALRPALVVPWTLDGLT